MGAGATFPQPVYALWAQDFTKVESDAQGQLPGHRLGGGIQQFTAKTVDFGATDVPLKASEASAITEPYIEFPTVLGAVVVSYNVPGLTAPLKLDGPTVASIFLGKIKNWNDPAIAAQNAGVTLPNTADPDRAPCRRLGHLGHLHRLARAWRVPTGRRRSAPASRSSGRSARVATATPASPRR